MPHTGTWIPADIADTLSPIARRLPDTDWWVERLYAFASDCGATLIRATHARYVIDLNRPPDNSNLYPGSDSTELCPLTTFDHEEIYLPGQEPDDDEITRRLHEYWQPYHDVLKQQIERLRSAHENILLWDAHSIRSVAPRFFEGRLPDLNLGTGGGVSCAPQLLDIVSDRARAEGTYSVAVNGRFKGGFITRNYGHPARGVHAIQLELSQATYMEEKPPFRFLDERAAAATTAIGTMLHAAMEWINASQANDASPDPG